MFNCVESFFEVVSDVVSAFPVGRVVVEDVAGGLLVGCQYLFEFAVHWDGDEAVTFGCEVGVRLDKDSLSFEVEPFPSGVGYLDSPEALVYLFPGQRLRPCLLS